MCLRRSPSRSPRRRGGRRSRSRSRSPRRRKKKTSLWDQAPTTTDGADPAAAAAPHLAGFTPGITVQLPDGTTGDMGSVMGRKAAIPSASAFNQLGLPGIASGADFMHVTRQARRLYVGNLPFGSIQVSFVFFFLSQSSFTVCGLLWHSSSRLRVSLKAFSLTFISLRCTRIRLQNCSSSLTPHRTHT